MKKYSLILPFLPILLSSHLLWASGEPDAFTLPGAGARAAGMGGAFIGLADDVETVYYNPAGLGQLKNSNVSAMYQAPSLGLSRSFVAANYRWPDERFPGSIAMGWLRLSSGDIELTSSSEEILGSDTFTNNLLLFSAGVELRPSLHVGATIKYLHLEFGNFRETGAGLDLGVHWAWEFLRLGCAYTDVTATQLKGNSFDSGVGDVSDKIPPRLRPGIALVSNHPFDWPVQINGVADARIKLQGAQDIALMGGAEVWMLKETLGVRSGYQASQGPTFGASYRWKRFQLDYAFLFSQNLENEHRFSTAVRF